MAANKKQETEKREMDVKFEGLGEYQEATGGGEPIPKGQKMTTQKRVMQPRDENGQFTYNAANKKPLKYGPSRGKTTPPYLRVRDTEIEEKEGERRVRNENIWDVTVKLSGYDKGQLIKDCREYLEGYKDEGHEEGFKYRTDLGDVTFTKKPGAKSQAEKAAIISDYKGDVKGLKFEGDKEQLKSDWKEFKEKGVKTSRYKEALIKREVKPEVKSETKPEAKSETKPETKPEVKQPEMKQPEVKQSPKSTGPFNDDDKKLASENGGMEFVTKYANELNEINDFAKSKGWDGVDIEGIVSAISTGEVSSFDEIKKMIEEAEKE